MHRACQTVQLVHHAPGVRNPAPSGSTLSLYMTRTGSIFGTPNRIHRCSIESVTRTQSITPVRAPAASVQP